MAAVLRFPPCSLIPAGLQGLSLGCVLGNGLGLGTEVWDTLGKWKWNTGGSGQTWLLLLVGCGRPVDRVRLVRGWGCGALTCWSTGPKMNYYCSCYLRAYRDRAAPFYISDIFSGDWSCLWLLIKLTSAF